MLNGKKFIRAGIFSIFASLFMIGNVHGYTQLDDCYTDRTNGNYHGTCRDYNVNESFNTNGATVSYGAYLNTPGNSKTFLYTIEGEYNNKTWRSEYYLLYREDGYTTIFQGLQNLTDNNTSLYIYTGNGKFCIPTDNINVCGSASNNANTAYTKTIDEVNSGINNSIMTGYKILYSTTQTTNLPFTNTTNAICPMYDNGFIFCMPLRSESNPAGTVANMGRYGLGTRTNIFSSQAFTNIYDYINTNYTIGNTQFTYIEPTLNTGSNVVCPSVQFKISMYGYKYNTGLCYTDPLEFTGGQIIQVEQQSIFEIFSGYQEYLNRKYIYENNCHAPYTDEHCINAMQTNRKAKQIFSKIENAGLDSEKVYQYCHLQLEIEDKTQGVCNMTEEELYATGVNQQGSQPNPFESLTDFIEDNINLGVEAPREGSVFDEFLEDGETWISAITINRFGEFRKLYQKVMGLFKYREAQVGIIPGYITGIMMMILLLALFKK